jgi:hypothetical protein
MPAHDMCVGLPSKTEYYEMEQPHTKMQCLCNDIPHKKIVVSIN